jgi:hypothetical protein
MVGNCSSSSEHVEELPQPTNYPKQRQLFHIDHTRAGPMRAGPCHS